MNDGQRERRYDSIRETGRATYPHISKPTASEAGQ